MGKVEKLEQQIEALSPEELAQFRAWFLDFDWAAWDAQLVRRKCELGVGCENGARFLWDARKAASNLKRHGVGFPIATTASATPFQ